MISVAPAMLLSHDQASRLLTYKEYRRSALMDMPPTQERNATLRLVQGLQGRLLALFPGQSSVVQFVLTREETIALQVMARGLLQFYGEKSDLPDRTTIIADVGRLYAYLKQLVR